MNKKRILNWMSKLMYVIYLGSIAYFIFVSKLENVLFALASLLGTIITLIIFILFSGLLGSSFGFYHTIKNYDDFLHIWSGIISCSVAYVLFNYFGNMDVKNTKRKIFFIIFMFMFSMGGASLWELMEFFIDKFLGMNCQAGGLVDTMMDTFDCLIGSVIMIPYYVKQLPKLHAKNA